MSGRELVILLLGLAIVAVVLRGLYVAINARRGQIKLAIDKNIPQNVDLEALEMAELPGGGARVVTRSLEEVNRQNSALDMAESKARAIHLADGEDEAHIPVLMDAVELSEVAEPRSEAPAQMQAEQRVEQQFESEIQREDVEVPAPSFDEAAPSREEFAEDVVEDAEEEFESFVDTTPSIGENWEEEDEPEQQAREIIDDALAEPSTTQAEPDYQDEAEAEASYEEDPDSVLFDYAEDEPADSAELVQAEGLSSVAPDYDDDEEATAQDAADSAAELPDDDSYEDEAYDDAHYAGDSAEPMPHEQGDELEAETEPDDEAETFNADNSVDEFSMTAGERIGGNPAVGDVAKQSGLFDDDAEPEAESKPKKSRSLFSMFGRKSASSASADEADTLEQEAPAEDLAIEELPEEAPAVEETVQAEAVAEQQAMDYEDERVDELDQKRASVQEYEAEEAPSQSTEFEQSEVLVLNVMAKEGRVFAGDDLLHILITSGLKFGDMNIFHKRLSRDNQGSVIFSVANMLNPGTFDLNNMDEFTTLGISFFLALPTPINNLDAFQQMLDVAQTIRDTLGGDLKDDHRNGMTAQTIEHYRQRIRDFELRRLKAVAARG